MTWQKSHLACHHPVANDICNEAVLLVSRGRGDVRFPADTHLAPRDKLRAADFVGVAGPPILVGLSPDNVDHRPLQALGKEGTIHDRTGNNSNTSLGERPDNVVLLRAHHVRRPGSGRRSTPRQNLIPARILGATVRTGELLSSSVGGGAVPALPCDLPERRWHFDGIGEVFVRVFVRRKKKKTPTKTQKCCDIGLPVISFEPKALQRRSTYGRNRLAHRKMDIMLGTRLRAGITIEIRMRPRPMYAFRVILLMPRYAYAAYPTVVHNTETTCLLAEIFVLPVPRDIIVTPPD